MHKRMKLDQAICSILNESFSSSEDDLDDLDNKLSNKPQAITNVKPLNCQSDYEDDDDDDDEMPLSKLVGSNLNRIPLSSINNNLPVNQMLVDDEDDDDDIPLSALVKNQSSKLVAKSESKLKKHNTLSILKGLHFLNKSFFK